MTSHPSHLNQDTVPLQQSPAFAAALALMGVRLDRVESAAGPVTVIKRGPLGLISRADPVGLKPLGPHWLIINAESHAGAKGLPLMTPASVAELDLTPSPEDLRAAMAQKWRNRLNRALARPMKLSETAFPPDPHHWLLRIEASQRETKGYRGIPSQLSAAFAQANPGKARLFEARQKGKVIAAMLWLTHGTVATYQIGWSGPEGRQAAAHHRLLWQAMDEFQARGIKRLDLGTVATDQAPGLARFKLGSGAKLRRLGGTWGVWSGRVLR